jgi:hypothetical protein
MRRISLAALLAFFSLLITGVATPALAAPPTPTSFRLATGGSGNTSLRVQWTWQAGIASYDLEVATDTSFTQPVKQSVAGSSSKPSSGVVAVTVSGLKNATTYGCGCEARLGRRNVSVVGNALRLHHCAGRGFGRRHRQPWPRRRRGDRIRWTSDGSFTTSFHVETALTTWNLTSPPAIRPSAHGLQGGRDEALLTLSLPRLRQPAQAHQPQSPLLPRPRLRGGPQGITSGSRRWESGRSRMLQHRATDPRGPFGTS